MLDSADFKVGTERKTGLEWGPMIGRSRRVLVTGASGSLGWNLCRHLLSKGYEVTGTFKGNRPSIPGLESVQLSLEDPAAIEQVLTRVKPEAVIHTAAMTNPDDCENNPPLAGGINVGSTGLFARLLDKDALFVFTSTDLVFDGSRGLYEETDETSPVNFYGETKIQAERQVLHHPNGVVLRLAKLYSYGSPFHPCFVTWMKERFERGVPLPLFTDQFRSPIFVEDAARAVVDVLEQGARDHLYHLGGPDRLSRTEFGEAFARVMGFDVGLIRPTLLSDSGLVARGADCSLNSTRFYSDYGFEASPLHEGLVRLKAGFKEVGR